MSVISSMLHFGGAAIPIRKVTPFPCRPVQTATRSSSSLSDEVQFSGRKVKKSVVYSTIAVALLAAYGGAEVTTDVNPFDLTGHYMWSGGQPIDVNFEKLDLGDMEHSKYFPDLQAMAEEMKRNNITHMPVDYKFGIVLPDLDEYTLGGLNVKLTGELVRTGDKWELKKGVFTGESDYFDYDVEAGHRDSIGEGGTKLFSAVLPGKPYWVNFHGSQSYQAQGRC